MLKYKKLIYNNKNIILPSKIKKILLNNNFDWFLKAEIENSIIEITENGNFIWHMGSWYKGHWHGQHWLDGIWYDGYWHQGEWHNGVWYNGTWVSGIWYNGIWKKGIWKNGEKKNTYTI
jgi:hypothetical protein